MKYFKYLGLILLLFSSFFGMGQTVTSVSSTAANGTYKVGDVIPVTVTFSADVTVTGAPQITLETGSTDVVVEYCTKPFIDYSTFVFGCLMKREHPDFAASDVYGGKYPGMLP